MILYLKDPSVEEWQVRFHLRDPSFSVLITNFNLIPLGLRHVSRSLCRLDARLRLIHPVSMALNHRWTQGLSLP